MTKNVERIKVDLTQLSVDLPLRYDLQTTQGSLLAYAGTVVTRGLKEQWKSDGIQFADAIVKRNRELPENTEPIDPAVADHDPLVVERLEATIFKASEFVLGSALQIARGETTETSEAEEIVQRLKVDIVKDVASVLTAFARSLNAELSDSDQLLAQRSSQLSVLGLLIAHQLGYSDDDQLSTAIAGMFHDIALLECVRQGENKASHGSYSNHPSLSASLFESAVGDNAKVAIAISQVHEQIDGTGFPKQLRLGRIMPIARILNVADAYLTLTSLQEPNHFPKACMFHPADAIGYLMYHAARGRFDRRAVRALIDIGSLYPVGCRVELSDNSTAIVMRSSLVDPSRPIVRIETASSPIVDLRRSPLTIARPSATSIDHCRRLRKSKIGEVYWL